MWMTVRDLAEHMNVKPDSIYAGCAQGWPHMRVGRGGRIRFTEEQVAAIERACRVAPPATRIKSA